MIELELLYIGPGLGGGVVAAILGILTAFGLTLFAVLWYPLKKMVKLIHDKYIKKG